MMRPLLMILEDEKREYEKIKDIEANYAIFSEKMKRETDEKAKKEYAEIVQAVNQAIDSHTEQLKEIRRELRVYSQLINAL